MNGFVNYRTTMQLDCSYQELSDWVEKQYPGSTTSREKFRIGLAEIELINHVSCPACFEYVFEIRAPEAYEKQITSFLQTVNNVFGETLKEMIDIFLRHPNKVMAKAIFWKAQKHLAAMRGGAL